MASLRDRVRGAGLACAAALALAACSHDTTILVRVTRDASVPATVPRLHVAIGVRGDGDVVAPATTDAKGTTDPTYVDDTPAGELVDTSRVDLATAPYEVELRPSAQFTMDTGLELAAVAFSGEAADRGVIGFGAIGHEVHFRSGETLVYEITLTAVAAPTVDPGRRDCGTLAGDGASVYACKAGCVRFDGDAGAIWIGAHDDVDCDGDPRGSDCDDLDWQVNHMATDVCNNGKNDDCAGGIDDGLDRDGDGLTPCQGDCVDNPNVPGSKDIHPGAPELCDGVDDNCNGKCDEGLDTDGDHFTVCGTVDDTGAVCTYVGAATCAGNGAACDCAEGHPLVYPGGPGPELCDGLDERCDGVRFAMDTACFATDGGGICRIGSRTCDDGPGGGGFGACTPGNLPAPPEACTQFNACATDPDPIACVAKKITNATQMGCDASLDQAANPVGLCPVPPSSYVVLLPPVSGTTLCGQADWILVGGAQHGAWTVGLTDPAQTAPPSPTVTGQCQANLVVTQVTSGMAGAAPPPTTLLILVRRPLSIDALVFDLAGEPTTTCPAGSAMLCHMSG
jgi:Putative metal-binding motif